MKSLGEIFKGLMGGKPKVQEAAPVDPAAQRLASLNANQEAVGAQAAAQGIASPATPEAVPAQPVAQPTPLK